MAEIDHVTIIERLTRVEEKIDTLVSRAVDNSVRLDGHEIRLRELETSKAKYLGMGAVIAAVAGFFGDKVVGGVFGS